MLHGKLSFIGTSGTAVAISRSVQRPKGASSTFGLADFALGMSLEVVENALPSLPLLFSGVGVLCLKGFHHSNSGGGFLEIHHYEPIVSKLVVN